MKRNRNGKLSDREAKRTRWVKRYRASGLGLRRFAEEHGLKPSQLHYWVYQSPKHPVRQAALPAFQEVRLPATELEARLWSTEIGLPNGTTVRLARETELAWTLALIDSLRKPCLSR